MKSSSTPTQTALVTAAVRAVVSDLRAEPDPKARLTAREACAKAGGLLGLSPRRARAYVDGDVTVTEEAELAKVQAALLRWSESHAAQAVNRIRTIRAIAGRPNFSRADLARVGQLFGRHHGDEDASQVRGCQGASAGTPC